MSDVAAPAIGADEVLVRVRACGICGSDVHGYDGSSGRRIPPLIMGHEAAGEVEAVGMAVGGISPGARVTFDSTVWCGRCDDCRRGQVNLCAERRVLGVSCADYRRDGAFAEFVAVPARIVHRLPDEMPYEHAALVEAVSVAAHAVARKPPSTADTVVVIGCGMIGLLVIQVLKAYGCTRIVGVDPDSRRRALAAQFGAADTIEPAGGDVGRQVREAVGQRGADHVFEVVGRSETLLAAVSSARRGGAVTLIGNLAPSVDLPLQAVVTGELTLVGSCASSGEYPACIDLVAQRVIDVAPLISATAPLEEGPLWFERLQRHDDGLMKVILTP